MTRPTNIGRGGWPLSSSLGGDVGDSPGSPPSPSCCDPDADIPDRAAEENGGYMVSLSTSGAPAYVQHKVGGSGATLDADPTPGNLLVAWLVGRNDEMNVLTSGWTEVARVENTTGFRRHGVMLYRVSSGSDGTIQTTLDAATSSQAIIAEFVGSYAGAVAEADSVGATTNLDCGGAVTATANSIVIGGAVLGSSDADYPGLAVSPDAGTDEVYDSVNDIEFSPGMWFGYREVSSPGSEIVGGTMSASVPYCGVSFLIEGSDPLWIAPEPLVIDGDDATYEAITGTDLLRTDLGAPYRIVRTRIRVGANTSGARTFTIKGANLPDFSDEVTLATIPFTATGSYTPQDLTALWTTTESYRYFELSSSVSDTYRVHAWELYEATLATNHQHTLVGLSDVSGTLTTGDVLAYSSNTQLWQPRSTVHTITSNASNLLVNPFLNFVSGSGIAFSAASNALTISSTVTGGGAASLSYGSNATRVSEDSAAGSESAVARADHLHDGIGTITASSSNTLQRGTVNLRSGTGIALALTNTDGDGEFDTITIVNTIGAGGGGGGGGGAPTDAEYIVSAANGSLSAETVISSLRGSIDVHAGGGSDDEFVQNSSGAPSGWSTLGSLSTLNTNDAYSQLHLAANDGNLYANGIYISALSMPFTMTVKITEAQLLSNYNAAGLFLGEAGGTGKLDTLHLLHDNAINIQRYSWTNRTTLGSNNNYAWTANQYNAWPMYLRAIVTSSSNVTYQISHGGRAWRTLVSSHNPGFTVAIIGVFVMDASGSSNVEAWFDWVRFT